MKKLLFPPSMRHLRIPLTGIAIALCLLVMTTAGVFASTVRISDAAGILNTSRVMSEGQNLPDPLDIYTTNHFSGTKTQFNQQAVSHINQANKIVMAIDSGVGQHYVVIVGGTSAKLNSSQYQQAANTFASNFNNGDYTGATIAAIQSLESSLGVSNGGNFFSGILGILCIVALVIVVGVILFAVFRRRRGPRVAPAMPYQQQYPPNYNPNYPGGYPPGYNQGQGMNPWVAGGLGAAGGGLAGGLIGYELGKEEGAEQANQQMGGGGNFGGGGGGSDFGGGGGGGGSF